MAPKKMKIKISKPKVLRLHVEGLDKETLLSIVGIYRNSCRLAGVEIPSQTRMLYEEGALVYFVFFCFSVVIRV